MVKLTGTTHRQIEAAIRLRILRVGSTPENRHVYESVSDI
jgi:hypothetical protein